MPRIIDALEQLFTVDSLASGPSLLINYSSASGSFSVGETVTGGTSGATLVVNTSIPPQVTGSAVVGTFQVGETITGGTSGATATVDNFFLYDFPAGAAPLENGEIDFFESGSSTVRKTTYSDAAETIPNANPLVIRGDGRVPDVYGSGTYRIVVRTSTGIQILARDPIGGDQGLSFGADWSASIVYSETDVVRDDGKYWQSLTSNNSNNQPSVDAGVNWVELPFTDITVNTANIDNLYETGISDWNPAIPYQAAAWARSTVDNVVYELLPAGDPTNEPSASPADWSQLSTEIPESEKVELKSGRKNAIINGNFDIWQRGTSATSNGYGSNDRWFDQDSGSTKVNTRESFAVGQTDVPNNPSYFSRTTVTSVVGANNVVNKQQKIENVRSFSGETATLTFWAKADSNKDIATEFAQVMGTGGSPSSNVLSIGVTTHNLTTSWQKFTVTTVIPSISGKTLGSNNDDYLSIIFYFDAGSNFDARTNSLGQQSGTFDIAQVQIEKGTFATDFDKRSIGEELLLCQRYYEISTGSGGNGTAPNDYATSTVNWKVTKRAIPASAATPGTISFANENFVRVSSSLGSYTVTGDAEL